MNKFIITLLFIFLPTPSMAAVICTTTIEYDLIINRLKKNYNEELSAAGLTNLGQVLQVIKSPKGSWTVILVWPSGRVCVVATGDTWLDLSPTYGERS